MPFGFGGDRTDSSSQSQSSSFDNLDSFGFNFGQSGSSSRGGSAAESSQRVAFEDIFARLFGGASDVASGIDTGGLTGAANELFGAGGTFLDTLGGGGAGAGFLEDRLSGDGLADEQIGLLGEDIARFVAEELNPAITSGGVAASTFGGARTNVQKGTAARGASEAFARGAADIRSSEQATRDRIAETLAADETTRGTAGLSALPSLFGLAEAGTLADLSPFAALSQIVGAPTVLGESSSISQQIADAFGIDFGFDETTGRAGSQSTSSSSTRSRGFNFGFGGD